MSDSLNQFVQEWAVLLRRVEHLETQVLELTDNLRHATQSAPQAPAPGPYAPPPGMQAPVSQVFPAAPQAPQAPAAPPPAAPGPQSVPTFDQLLERMMQLAEAKGDQACIKLIEGYGGKDEHGTVKISLVPKEHYATLFAEVGTQLGLH